MFTTDAEAPKSSDKTIQYYRKILNCMPGIVYIIDNNCILTDFNSNFMSILDTTEPSLNESPYAQLITANAWSETRINQLKLDDIKVLVSATAVYNVEEPVIVNTKGDIIYYLATRVPLLNENNQTVALVVILTDISEQKKQNEQLIKLKEELQLKNKQTPAANTLEQKSSSHIKVLMVEDDIIAQQMGRSLLLQANCMVDVAESGVKAIALFNLDKYDLVLMDINLKDMPGYLISKEIRKLEQNTGKHVPIIALTSFDADVVKEDCDDSFMEGVITKPLTSEQINQIIQHYVRHINIDVTDLKKGVSSIGKFISSHNKI